MSLFAQNNRDFDLVNLINRELLGNIIEQKVGYYKIVLSESPSNIYGEAPIKTYNDPVLLNCLIVRGDMTSNDSDLGPDILRTIEVRILRQDMVDINLFPETGDIVMWNENYYEVTLKNLNQLWGGKDPDYSYANSTDKFGGSVSVILNCEYIRPEKLGLKQQR